MRVSGIATGSDENGLSCVATGSVLNERVSDMLPVPMLGSYRDFVAHKVLIR